MNPKNTQSLNLKVNSVLADDLRTLAKQCNSRMTAEQYASEIIESFVASKRLQNAV